MKKFTRLGTTVKQYKDGTYHVILKDCFKQTYEAKFEKLSDVDCWIWNMADNHDIYREINKRLNEVFR